MLSESDGSIGYIDNGEIQPAYRGRRAGRAYKGFPGTWEILPSPFVTLPGGYRANKPWPSRGGTEHCGGANKTVPEGTAERKENEVRRDERQEVGASW